jgi:hypothetical protein
MNGTMTVQWTDVFDGHGRDDGLNSVDVSNSIVAVGGYSFVSGSTSEAFTASYNSTGTKLWERSISPYINSKAEVNKVKVDPIGQVYSTGKTENSSLSDFETIAWDVNGIARWAHLYDGASSGPDVSKNLVLASTGEVYVLGFSESSSESTTTKATSLKVANQTVTLVPNGDETFAEKELLIRFDKSQMNMDAAYNQGFTIGSLPDFVLPGMITMLTTTYPAVNWNTAKAMKVFPKLTPDNVTTKTRQGKVISIPDYWATLRVIYAETEDEVTVANAINTLFPDLYHAELNKLAHSTATANDTEYANQASLHPTASFSNGQDVDVEAAWDYEVGQSLVKVGVCDCPIRYSHEDFGDGSFSGSKVVDGFNYDTGMPANVENMATLACAHGTQVAGIIGAIRNNNLGVAGIAGGDATVGNTGVSLYTLGVASAASAGAQPVSENVMANGLLDGALDPTVGFGLHILSLSSGFEGHAVDPVGRSTIYNLNRTLFRSGVTLFNSRDNDGTNNEFYPATLGKDEWVVSVGANDENPLKATFSSYGSNMDFLAPGVSSLISTTGNGDATYGPFTGTSASTPHAAGIAGLMMSLQNPLPSVNGSLAPEDIENLMEQNCLDLDPGLPGYNTFYDEFSGWGIAKAGPVLAELEPPFYRIVHVEGAVDVSLTPVYEAGATVNTVDGSLEAMPLLGGASNMTAQVYKVSVNISHNLLAGTTILGAWERNSSSNLYPNYDFGSGQLVSETGIELGAYDLNAAHLTGYFYFLQDNLTFATGWFPFDPTTEMAEFAYTLHTYRADGVDPYDPLTVTIDDVTDIDEESINFDFEVYPNPSNSMAYLKIPQDISGSCLISIISLDGKILWSKNESLTGKDNYMIDLSNLASGSYFVRIQNEQGIKTKTIVKN